MTLTSALLLTGIFHALLLFAHGTHIALTHGIAWGTGRRDQAVVTSDLDRRFARTIMNNVESMVAFVPLAAAAGILGMDSEMLRAAALTYVVARMVFAAVYLANIPYLRTAIWFVGQGAIVAVFLAAIGEAI